MPRVKLPLKLLYLDIETTPLKGTFWNLWPKYIPLNQMQEPTYILCWGAQWHGDREVIFSSVKGDGRENMIRRMHALLEQADAVCHYNGKAFDMKHLNREFALYGLNPPSHYSQVDLLSEVKKNFKLPSNKLDYVCRYFGLGGKVKHAGIELWYGCMEGNERDWKIMERYNKQDVKLLPKLYRFMRPWIKDHPNVALYIKDPTKPTCPKCASTKLHKKGTQHNTKKASYDRYTCLSCGEPCRSRFQSAKTSANVLVRSQ